MTRFEKILPFVVYGATGVVFLPVMGWLLRQTVTHNQLLNAFLVFLLTGALMVYERRISLRLKWSFGDLSQNLLVLAYAVLAVAVWSKVNLAILAALSLSMASLLLFVFGREQQRLVLSATGAFALFTAIAFLLPVLDWPLRTVAGKWAAYGLTLIGQTVELGFTRGTEGPMLILLNNGRPFHVAAECNGFGMLGSSLLMATIVLLYRRLPVVDRIGWLLMAMAVGLAFNILRIIIIVLLAPVFPESAYMAMHETIGLVSTYGGLTVLYFLLMPREEINRLAASGKPKDPEVGKPGSDLAE